LINTKQRLYNYFTLGEENEYGIETVSEKPKGTVKMAIFPTSIAIQDNINYKDSNYIGLTLAKVDDTYIIENGKERLKVLYVNPTGRYNQVFMKVI
jgi:hypothetical protein